MTDREYLRKLLLRVETKNSWGKNELKAMMVEVLLAPEEEFKALGSGKGQ